MKGSIAIGLALAAGLVVHPMTAHAQATWNGGTPVYDSDVRKRTEQEEAQRAERRSSAGTVVYPKFMNGGERPDIKPSEPPIVFFDRNEEVGSIIVDTKGRRLYYVLPGNKAYEYPISVGRDGFTWSGTERVSRIAAWPSWTPPPEMHKRVPGLPITVSGGLKNPQGARALYLGSTIYRIHGTNNDRTVGRANSSGCFRLTNEHIVHLASIAKVGTKVKVMQAYTGGVSQGPPVTGLTSLTSLFSFGDSDETPPAAPPKAKPKPKPAGKTAAVPDAKKSAAAAAPAVAPAAAVSAPPGAAPEAVPAPAAATKAAE